jgi:hypothetical protein
VRQDCSSSPAIRLLWLALYGACSPNLPLRRDWREGRVLPALGCRDGGMQ